LSELSAERLEREARVFTAALIGDEPSAYVIRQYAHGHMSLPLAPAAGFERVLLFVARGGPYWTRAADAYARLFARRAILRRKLTLLIAILESTSPSDAAFAPIRSFPAGTVLRLALAGTGAVVFTVAGLVVLGPLHLLSRLAAGRT
jgi:hypothetical protein